jgi:hypothetical protein
MAGKTFAFFALAAALAASFAYGFRAHRDRLFPADLIDPPPPREVKRLTNGSLVWQPLRKPADPSLEARERSAREVESLPYLQGYKGASQQGGVTLDVPGETSPGVNLFLSGHAPEARLIDMKGAVLHEWRLSFREAFPSATIPSDRKEESTFWRRVHLCPNGDLIAIFQGLGIIRIDKNSKLLWAVGGDFHHAVDVDAEGRIYALEGEWKRLPRINRESEVMEDFVSVLDKDGRRLARTSLLRCFERSDYTSVLARMETTGDIFHTNTIQVLDGSLEKKGAVFKKGNLLLSFLALNTIGIVDLSEKKVEWTLSGMWHGMHEPALLPSGRMLPQRRLPRARVRAVHAGDRLAVRRQPRAPALLLEGGYQLSAAERQHAHHRIDGRTRPRGDARQEDGLGVHEPVPCRGEPGADRDALRHAALRR